MRAAVDAGQSVISRRFHNRQGIQRINAAGGANRACNDAVNNF